MTSAAGPRVVFTQLTFVGVLSPEPAATMTANWSIWVARVEWAWRVGLVGRVIARTMAVTNAATMTPMTSFERRPRATAEVYAVLPFHYPTGWNEPTKSSASSALCEDATMK